MYCSQAIMIVMMAAALHVEEATQAVGTVVAGGKRPRSLKVISRHRWLSSQSNALLWLSKWYDDLQAVTTKLMMTKTVLK